MNRHLKQAIQRFDRGAYPEALDALVEAWRWLRAPALAEAVERLDVLLHRPAFASTAKAWAEAAETATASVERGPLIRALASMTCKQIADGLALMAAWDDPRVGALVATLLRELRFTGAVSRTFWRDVCALIPTLNDPRFLELKQTLPVSWNVGEDLRRYLTNRLSEATAALAPPKPLPAAEGEAVEQLLVALGREKDRNKKKTASAAGTTASAEDLLAHVYDNPGDDEPRAVYADWLLERGDPRGELIALQLHPGYDADRKAKKRVKELLKVHKKQWLGGIAPMLGGSLEFRRGFVAVATAKFRNQKDVEQFGYLPEWATLDELESGGPNVRNDQVDWGHWVGSSMRHVRVLRKPRAKHLLTGDVIWQIEELTLGSYPDGLVSLVEYRQILTSPQLPKLRRLTVHGSLFGPEWLEGVTRCPPTLGVNRPLDRGQAWLAAAERTEAERFVLDWYGVANTFSRDDRGRFSRLDTLITPSTKIRSLGEPLPAPVTDYFDALRALNPGSLSHFHAEIVVGGKRVPASPALEAGKDLVRVGH